MRKCGECGEVLEKVWESVCGGVSGECVGK